MKSHPELVVVMPVFNEEATIGPVIERWSRLLDSLEIDYGFRVTNDGSRDRTGEILRELASVHPRLEVRNQTNRGHGPTILEAYRNASGSPWLLQIDSDDEIEPDGFPRMWRNRDAYDFLLGCRAERSGPWARRAVSLVARLVVALCYGGGVYDVNSPYRLMRVEIFRTLFTRLPDDTFAPNLIVSGHACRCGLRILETPVPYHPRRTGNVSIKHWRLCQAALRSFFQTIRFRFRRDAAGTPE